MESHELSDINHEITQAERQLLIDTINAVVAKGHDTATPLGENETPTPKEWRDNGEEYGRYSSMIIVHDGGDHAGFFNYDYCQYDHINKMYKALEPLGFYAEQCTCWYSAIYRSPDHQTKVIEREWRQIQYDNNPLSFEGDAMWVSEDDDSSKY